MGSTRPSSLITKNKMLPLIETVLYAPRVTSIFSSSIVLSSILITISLDIYLDVSRVVINYASSKIFSALLSSSNYNIYASDSFIILLYLAKFIIFSSLYRSTSGFSAFTTSANN